MHASLELKQAGIGAARDARAQLALVLEAHGEAHPELAERLAKTVGVLFRAEVGDAPKVLEALDLGMTQLRTMLADDRWINRDAIARELARACATIHPARSELARALGARRGDATAPFLLESTKVKPSEPPGDDERRVALRAELETQVGLEGENRFFTGKTGDVSKGGLFIATDEPLPVGMELMLNFVLPGGARVRAEAVVAWVRAPRYRPHELPSGMGLRFDAIEADQLEAIRHFLEERPAFHYGE